MRKDIQNLTSSGLGVDNDNEPAPENDQHIDFNANVGVYHDVWTSDAPGACERIKNVYRFGKSKIN